MKNETSSSSCLVETNETWLGDGEEKRFETEGEDAGRKAECWSTFRAFFPVLELKPLELWCPAKLIDKVTSQISMFSLSRSRLVYLLFFFKDLC